MNNRYVTAAGAVMTALAFTFATAVFAGSDPFHEGPDTKAAETKAVKPGEARNPKASPLMKPKPGSTNKPASKPIGKKPIPDISARPDDDRVPLRDRFFRMNAEGYLIIGSNTYRLRSISGTLMVGGLCRITVSGDISRSFSGRWSGTMDKPSIVITSGDIGTVVDGRGSATVSGLNASFVGFSGRVGNDFYRVKMPVAPGEGGYWLNNKWQDNRDGSQELSNPPDRPVNEGAVVVPSNYWTGVCSGSFEAYASDYYTSVNDFILDARSSERVSLTISNRRTGDRWTVWGTIRVLNGNTWELDPYLINNTAVSYGRWWIEFSAFRRRVTRMEITGDTSRGGFRVVMQQSSTTR